MRYFVFCILLCLVPFIKVSAQNQIPLTIDYCSMDTIPKIKQELWDAMVDAVYDEGGSIDKGIEKLYEIQECTKLINDDNGYASTLIFLSYFMKEKNELEEMKIFLDELSSIIDDLEFDKYNKSDIKSELSYLFGLYYNKKGYYEEALTFYQKSIDFLFEMSNFSLEEELDVVELGKDFNFDKTDLFNNVAVIYLYFSDYDNALQNFKIAKHIINTDPYYHLNDEKGILLLHNMFRTYVELENDEMIQSSYDELNEVLPKMKDELFRERIKTNSYRNMALHLIQKGKNVEALNYLDKAKKINTEIVRFSAIFQLYSKAYLNISLDKSLEFADSANVYAINNWRRFHPEVAENFMIKGNTYERYKEYKNADAQYNLGINTLLKKENETCDCKSIPITDLSEKRMGLNIINEKAKTLSKNEDYSQSLECYEVIHQLILLLNDKYILNEESKYFFFQKTKEIYESAIKTAILNNDKLKAYEFSQSSRSLILLQQVQDKYAKQAAGVPDSVLKEGEDIKLKINEFTKRNQEVSISGKDDESTQWEQKIFNQNQLYNTWLNELEKTYSTYFELKYDLPKVSLNTIQHSLGTKKSTLIEYFLGEENLYIFVLDRNSVEVEVQEISDELFSDINIISESIKTADYSKGVFSSFNESSTRLYDILIGSVKDKSWIKNKNLIIIPDEQLNLIPYEVLVSNKKRFNDKNPHYHQLDYLIKEYDVSYHYSSNLLDREYSEKKKSRKDFLGIAPSFTGRDIAELENNLSEVKDAATYYNSDNSFVISGSNATYKEIMKSIKDYRMVHFATHAIFNDQIPLDSRIELADTSLYIYEIFGMKHNLDLAIISACETASGKQRKGEGVVSLSRAFIQSGCPTVIASLWSISDQKTSILMKNFHKYLGDGKTAKHSLSEAKRKYISEAMTKNVHPFYWAGFIQIGNENSNDDSGIPIYYWIVGLTILLLILYLIFRKK